MRPFHARSPGLRLAVIAALGALGLLAGGCGQEVDPSRAGTSPSVPVFARWSDGATLSPLSDGSSTPGATFTFDGSVGGRFVYRHVTLTFPPGAVEGTRTLRIETPDPQVALWDFHIDGTNEFTVPVTLEVNTSNQDDPISWGDIYWYDEESEQWVNMGGLDNPLRETCTTRLKHFSLYGYGGLLGAIGGVVGGVVGGDGTGGWTP